MRWKWKRAAYLMTSSQTDRSMLHGFLTASRESRAPGPEAPNPKPHGRTEVMGATQLPPQASAPSALAAPEP